MKQNYSEPTNPKPVLPFAPVTQKADLESNLSPEEMERQKDCILSYEEGRQDVLDNHICFEADQDLIQFFDRMSEMIIKDPSRPEKSKKDIAITVLTTLNRNFNG